MLCVHHHCISGSWHITINHDTDFILDIIKDIGAFWSRSPTMVDTIISKPYSFIQPRFGVHYFHAITELPHVGICTFSGGDSHGSSLCTMYLQPPKGANVYPASRRRSNKRVGLKGQLAPHCVPWLKNAIMAYKRLSTSLGSKTLNNTSSLGLGGTKI